MKRTSVLLVMAFFCVAAPAAATEDCVEDTRSQAEKLADTVLAAAKKIEVPWHHQKSPEKCLLYSLSMISSRLPLQGKTTPTADSLLAFALAHDYTTPARQGGMRLMDAATIARAHGYNVTHVYRNTSMRHLKDALASGVTPLVIYWADSYGAPAIPLVERHRAHGGGGNPNVNAKGQTREDPWARPPVLAGKGEPEPAPPTPVVPNYSNAPLGHAAVLTGFHTHEDVEYVTVVEPFFGPRVWRADQFEASFDRYNRQAVFVEKPEPLTPEAGAPLPTRESESKTDG